MVHDKKMHFMVLKPHRRYSGRLWEEWFKLLPCVGYCEIPALYKSLINFAKKRGFREVKIKPLSHKKNGKLYDIHVLEFKWEL